MVIASYTIFHDEVADVSDYDWLVSLKTLYSYFNNYSFQI